MAGPTRITLLDELKSTRSSDRWGEFFSSYGDLISRWLVSKNVSPADADDIQQETMIVVLKELPNFNHNGRSGAFRSWLKQILANRIRQLFHRKKSRKEQAILSDLAATLEDDSTRQSIEFKREHERFLIEQLLGLAEKRFPADRVQLFHELVIDGVPIEVLSEKYSLSKGTIRVQQHRILEWLKSVGQYLVDFDDVR